MVGRELLDGLWRRRHAGLARARLGRYAYSHVASNELKYCLESNTVCGADNLLKPATISAAATPACGKKASNPAVHIHHTTPAARHCPSNTHNIHAIKWPMHSEMHAEITHGNTILQPGPCAISRRDHMFRFVAAAV